MKLYLAKDIFTKTEFNNQVDWETYPTADYQCDNCKGSISIDFKNLTKHQLSDFSNLTSNDKDLFAQLESIRKLSDINSFLDFYCPTCHNPVRIYYESWAGGKHGEMGHVLKYVVR